MQDSIHAASEPQKLGAPSARQIVLATLAVAATLIAFWLLYQLRVTMMLLLAAIVLATAVQPVITWLMHRGLKRVLSAAITYLLLVVLLLGAGALSLPLLADQATAITGVIPEYYGKLRALLFKSTSWPVYRLALYLPPELSVLPGSAPAGTVTEEALLARMDQIMGFLGMGMRTLLGLVGVFLLAFYWSLERDHTIHWIVSFFSVTNRRRLLNRITDVEGQLEVFLAAQGTLCLIIGAASLAAYLIIGLPYALLLAVLAGIAEAVPLIGPLLGAVPALLIAITLDPSKVIGVLIATAIIQVLENNLLVPRVMSRAVGANPVITLIAFLVFSYLLGIAGAFIAVPIAVTLQWFFTRTVQNMESASGAPSEQRSEVSLLRYQVQEVARDLRKQMREDGESASPLDEVGDTIESVATELDSVLAALEEGKPI